MGSVRGIGRAAGLLAVMMVVMMVAMMVAMMVVLGCTRHSHTPPTPVPVSDEAADHVAQAREYERARRYDLARAAYQAALAAASDTHTWTSVSRSFADALIFWGEYTDAERVLLELTARAERPAGAWHDLGLLVHRRGDLAGAEKAFRAAIRSAPDSAKPRIALAALLWKSGRKAAALVEYRGLLALKLPDPVRDKVQWAIRELEAGD